MTAPHDRPRASGLIRTLGLLVLLLGVALMHSALCTPAAGAASPTGHTLAMMPLDHGGDPMNGDAHRDHSQCHPCVFVLSVPAQVGGLVLLYWLGIGTPVARLSVAGPRCRRRPRSPPWTVPSLAELSILRI